MKLTVTLITSAILSSLVAAVPWNIGEENMLNTKEMLTHSGQDSPFDERILDHGTYMYKRGIDSVWVEAKKKALNNLEWFFKDLRAFITNDSFNFRKFELDITELRETLTDLEFFSETSLIDEYNVDSSLSFARYMYQTMVDATEKMKKYNKSNYPGAHLVEQMIELNVRVLALYSSSGVPDPSINGYEKQVSNFYCTLLSLENDYKREDKMLSGMRKLYTASTDQVMLSIESLREKVDSNPRRLEACPRV
ncbi:hypothetical protein JCM33374_g5995 [Metschnikowia sp. JCM 33374]|nr:hypothetical protein JCM33374_g5995 [Metschnikowia sp. JCM 33374]